VTLPDVFQAGLFISAVTSTWLLSGATKRARFWGFLIAAVGQPFWFAAGYMAEQYGIMVLAFIFLFLQVRGARNNRSST
jgi:hypothetical protein